MVNDLIGDNLNSLLMFVNKNITRFFKLLFNLYTFITNFLLKTFKFLPLTIPVFIIIFVWTVLFVKESGQVDAMFWLLLYIGLSIFSFAFCVTLFIYIIKLFTIIVIQINIILKKLKKKRSFKNVMIAICLILAAIIVVLIMFIAIYCIRYIAIFNNAVYKKLNNI